MTSLVHDNPKSIEKYSTTSTQDLKQIDIRTRSVEKALEPLITQVTTLCNHAKRNEKPKRGRSKKASQLVKEIDHATAQLVEVGGNIANDFPQVKEAMMKACQTASDAGKAMHEAASAFALDPCTASKRGSMVKRARSLLSSVARLLCIADMADVHRLLATLQKVEDRLKTVEATNTKETLLAAFQDYGDDLMVLAKLTGLRQNDLKDARRRDDMAQARTILQRSSKMLLTSSKALVTHPDVATTKKNRDYVIKQVASAVATIAGVAQAVGESQRHSYEEVGYLAKAFHELNKQLERSPEDFQDERNAEDVRTLVEDISTGASNLAQSVCTREKTREKIIKETQNVKNVVDEFLGECHVKGVSVQESKKKAAKKTHDLKKQLRRSVVDHVSDGFIETNVPILMLMKAAESANNRHLQDCSVLFQNHTDKLLKVADLACSISSNMEGVKFVKMAAQQLKQLCPQVLHAACTLSERTNSKAARENLLLFKEAWMHQVDLLTDAVDDITTIDDFLAVSESHILEDLNNCIECLQEGEMDELDRTAGAIRGRVSRVEHVVTTEMESYEAGSYTEAVYKAVGTMRNRIMVEFAECVDMVLDALSKGNLCDVDESLFIDLAGLVHEGMRDIRKAVAAREGALSFDSDDEGELYTKESLLDQLARAQQEQRERLAYEQLIAGGKIQYEVHSEGMNDPGCKGDSFIIVNGVDYCPHKRGHNVVVLNQCGKVVHQKAFDTTLYEEGVAMAKFLDSLPEEHVVLMAVQETTGEGIQAASESLKRLGVKEDVNIEHGASWAFVGLKGDHYSKEWVAEVSRPRYEGPSMISNMINTPAADKGQLHVSIHAEGCEDEEYERISSIKINTIERSPMGRGMNVVVLDDAGNFLLSKNFDTADPSHAINEGKRMSRFLQELPEQRIVAIASLESVGEGLEGCKESLRRIGVPMPLNPGKNGSFAFIGYTDPEKVSWLREEHQKRGEGPSTINQFIVTPAFLQEEDVYEDNKYERVVISSPDNMPIKMSASSLMRSLPEEDKAMISKLNEGFLLEKNRLIREVNKWEEQGNEIIVLAKRMCMTMMDLSDFTRGMGPLKTTVDVIKAADKIGKSGAQLNKLAGLVAENCPHSLTRSDLMAYLQRVALYSHQLCITAKVKSDIQMIGGEMIVSGVESASSLIQAAKNLMNSVILTVKSSYIASTKHRTPDQTVIVTWRMRVPDKKPLLEKGDFGPRPQKVRQQHSLDSPADLRDFQSKKT